MQINVVHIRERTQSGGRFSCCLFDARAPSGTAADDTQLLARLTAAARAANLRDVHAALAFVSAGQLQYFGSKSCLQNLARRGLPSWTHTLTV